MIYLKMLVLVLSLGIDTLLMSISLGMAQRSGKIRLRIALTFALAEAVMPLIGMGIGHVLGHWIGTWASLLGGIALTALALWLLIFAGADEDERLESDLAGWALLVTALSISLDELAVGFSIALIGVPVMLTIILIAAQAFVLTIVGLTVGSKLKPYLGEWSEKLAGIALGLLGVWILADAIRHIA